MPPEFGEKWGTEVSENGVSSTRCPGSHCLPCYGIQRVFSNTKIKLFNMSLRQKGDVKYKLLWD